MVQQIQALADAYFEEIRTIRQHIHQNPELSFKEYNTSKFIQEKLDEFGITYKTGFVETGIVAHIYGNNPEAKVVALRGDMDALPIQEENEVSYKSLNANAMHACGHDVHTACLLGAAKILNELKDSFKGTIKLVFQPGEERLPGGAKLMLEEKALENPNTNCIIGQHVFPDLEVGKVGFKSGMYMASADEIYVTVKGKGGHAALPHKIVDPILMASQLVVSLQQVVSRTVQTTVPSVLSFGKIIGNGATNVIPDEVKLEGTFRCMDEHWREQAHKAMLRTAKGVADSMGGEIQFDIHKGYPCLINNDTITQTTKQAAIEYLGEENVIDLDLRMTSEDFAYFSQQYPSCFYRLGTNKEGAGFTDLHTSTFNIDEEALKIGMGLMAYGALKQLVH